MKKMVYQSMVVLLGFVLILTSGCEGSTNPDEAALDQMDGEMTDKIPVYTDIRNYTNALDAQSAELEKKGPITVTRDGQNYEVSVSFKDGEPVIIHAQTPMGRLESWYYLENRRLVMLKESGRMDDTFFERQFFYEGDTLLSAIHRRAGQSGNLPDTRFKAYESPYGENDFRTMPADAFASAMEFLMGR